MSPKHCFVSSAIELLTKAANPGPHFHTKTTYMCQKNTARLKESFTVLISPANKVNISTFAYLSTIYIFTLCCLFSLYNMLYTFS